MANITKTSGAYLTNWAWFRDIIGDKDMVLCHTSALECLELFVGYMNEKEIDVYAKKQGQYDNINYRILNNFNDIDVINIDGVLCTSFNQTVNDMLKDFENTDEQALAEALSNYYHNNGRSFSGLTINTENMSNFNYMKDWAVEYYNEGARVYDFTRTSHVSNYRGL